MLRKRLGVVTVVAVAGLFIPAVAYAGSCFWDCHGGAMSVYDATGDMEAANNAFWNCYNAFCNAT